MVEGGVKKSVLLQGGTLSFYSDFILTIQFHPIRQQCTMTKYDRKYS